MLCGFGMTMNKVAKETYVIIIGIVALLIYVIVYAMFDIKIRNLLYYSLTVILFGIYIIILTKLRNKKDEKEIKHYYESKKVIVIPKNLTPLCTVEPFVEIVRKVFKDVCASVTTDDVEPCKKSSIVEKRYEYILRDTKEDYKKEGHIYTTETAFFVIVYRIDVPDILWIKTVLDTIESVQKETFDYQTGLRKNGFRVVSATTSHNMKE